MFLLQWQGKPINDRPENLQKLANPIVPIEFVHEPVERVRDASPDECAMRHKFPIYPVENGLEVVPLPRVLRVEQVNEAEAKCVVNNAAFLRDLCVDLTRNNKAQQELVDDLRGGGGGQASGKRGVSQGAARVASLAWKGAGAQRRRTWR